MQKDECPSLSTFSANKLRKCLPSEAIDILVENYLKSRLRKAHLVRYDFECTPPYLLLADYTCSTVDDVLKCILKDDNLGKYEYGSVFHDLLSEHSLESNKNDPVLGDIWKIYLTDEWSIVRILASQMEYFYTKIHSLEDLLHDLTTVDPFKDQTSGYFIVFEDETSWNHISKNSDS